MTSNTFFETSLNEFFEKASSSQPVPGGGCINAITAANAASMVSMVCRITAGNPKFADVKETLESIIEISDRYIEESKTLAIKDQDCFSKVVQAWRLPANTEEKKKFKQDEIQKTSLEAAEVPLELMDLCKNIVGLCSKSAPISNSTVISDIGTAAHLALATLKSSALCVDINLAAIKNEQIRNKLITKKALLIEETDKQFNLAIADVYKKINN